MYFFSITDWLIKLNFSIVQWLAVQIGYVTVWSSQIPVIHGLTSILSISQLDTKLAASNENRSDQTWMTLIRLVIIDNNWDQLVAVHSGIENKREKDVRKIPRHLDCKDYDTVHSIIGDSNMKFEQHLDMN